MMSKVDLLPNFTFMWKHSSEILIIITFRQYVCENPDPFSSSAFQHPYESILDKNISSIASLKINISPVDIALQVFKM